MHQQAAHYVVCFIVLKDLIESFIVSIFKRLFNLQSVLDFF
jgi:hypothetical protein